MKAPKLLPWIARKAGIGDELALKLWRRAAGESEELVGCCDSADYYRLAMERFIDLVEAETRGDKPKFRVLVEAIIAEERAKQHHLVADRLSELITTVGSSDLLRRDESAGRVADLSERLRNIARLSGSAKSSGDTGSLGCKPILPSASMPRFALAGDRPIARSRSAVARR